MQKTAYEKRFSDWSSDVCSSYLSPAKAGEGRRFVGWVERSETHRPPCNQASRAMGFASLYPSYGRPPGGLPRSGRPAHNAVSRTARSRPMRHLPLAALATARSEEHTSELQSLMRISYAVLCLKTKKKHLNDRQHSTLPPPTYH